MAQHLNSYFCYEERDLVCHLNKYEINLFSSSETYVLLLVVVVVVVHKRKKLKRNWIDIHLTREQQPETLMVYVGIDNTYTPAHTDICGSIGHNLMVYADDSSSYALWFITERKYKNKASALFGKYVFYFLSFLLLFLVLFLLFDCGYYCYYYHKRREKKMKWKNNKY